MSSIPYGQEVLSLFGAKFSQPYSALHQKSSSGSLYVSLISVFLTVAILAAMLSLITKTPAPQAMVSEMEQVAYEPSQAVTSQISQGYLGR